MTLADRANLKNRADRQERILDGLQRAGVELVVLAGYYGLIGYVLNTFEAELPAGKTPAFAR